VRPKWNGSCRTVQLSIPSAIALGSPPTPRALCGDTQIRCWPVLPQSAIRWQTATS
jgi:hypothetical protein